MCWILKVYIVDAWILLQTSLLYLFWELLNWTTCLWLFRAVGMKTYWDFHVNHLYNTNSLHSAANYSFLPTNIPKHLRSLSFLLLYFICFIFFFCILSFVFSFLFLYLAICFILLIFMFFLFVLHFLFYISIFFIFYILLFILSFLFKLYHFTYTNNCQ